MRTLDQHEILAISGGADFENSNFSFVVEIASFGAFCGIPLAVIFSEPNVIILSAIVFGGFATVMALAQGLEQLRG